MKWRLYKCEKASLDQWSEGSHDYVDRRPACQ